jgi:hypothetical protein
MLELFSWEETASPNGSEDGQLCHGWWDLAKSWNTAHRNRRAQVLHPLAFPSQHQPLCPTHSVSKLRALIKASTASLPQTRQNSHQHHSQFLQSLPHDDGPSATGQRAEVKQWLTWACLGPHEGISPFQQHRNALLLHTGVAQKKEHTLCLSRTSLCVQADLGYVTLTADSLLDVP